MRVPEDADADYVAGALIIEDDQILLVNHKKYGIWLQPGGHIESNETPDEAAIREAREETGVVVEVEEGKDDKFEGEFSEDLPRPFNINLHKVEDDHWHIDFLYICRVEDEVKSSEYKSEDIKWLSKKDIVSDEYEIPDNVESTLISALEYENS